MPETYGISHRPIYMDHHATTPVDPRVLAAMLPYFTEHFGNAASIDHEYGFDASKSVVEARWQIANAIGAQPEEIVFTSGATEADNLAIIGVAEQHSDRGNHIITCITEHKAVLDSCHYLERKGWQVTYLPVDQFGMVNVDDVRRAITPNTVLVSIMAANNEIGTLAPIAEIGQITRERGVLFHSDATQAVGHVPVDVDAMNVDLISMSAHKMYGPKGVGALYVRKRRPRVRLEAQIHGGGHERGMRSGTLNVPGIIGMAKALKIAQEEMQEESHRLTMLRDHLWEGIQSAIPGAELNGHPTERLPHNLSIFIPEVESRSIIVQLKHDVALSTGSACTTAKVEPSHVILALGFGDERAFSSVRFGLGRYNTGEEIGFIVGSLARAVTQLRRLVQVS